MFERFKFVCVRAWWTDRPTDRPIDSFDDSVFVLEVGSRLVLQFLACPSELDFFLVRVSTWLQSLFLGTFICNIASSRML